MASILVVDDEPDVLFLTQVALEAEGHVVRTASDGDVALEAIETEVPDLVVLDVMMPEVDGWTVLDELKSHADERVASVRVIMMTSLGADIDKARGGVSGAVRYLVKPVDNAELLAVVHESLSSDEREQRQVATTEALQSIARIEQGIDVDAVDDAPRPRLAGLERARPRLVDDEDEVDIVGAELTATQRNILRTVAATDSVSNAAATLRVSRANIYASVRRSARTLGVSTVPELLEMLRSGSVVVVDD